MTRRTVYFSGHVQGVGFRFVTRQIASALTVNGYVRNLPDGRVQLVAEGEKPDLDQLLARIREKMQGYVETVIDETTAATGEFGVFEIRK